MRNVICFWVCVYHHQKHIRWSVAEVNSVIQKTATLWYTHRARMDWNASAHTSHHHIAACSSLPAIHIAKNCAVLFCDKHSSFFLPDFRIYTYTYKIKPACSQSKLCLRRTQVTMTHQCTCGVCALGETRERERFCICGYTQRCVHRA
jgi:hypothetical protein